MDYEELLDIIYRVQDQIAEGKIGPAVDDLNNLEDSIREEIDKGKMSPEAEDANAGVIRNEKGEVIGEES